MRVYIAASLQLLPYAKHLAEGLAGEGIEVASTWHGGEPTPARERGMDPTERAALAQQCFREIDSADALVLLYGGPTERHGSFLETGYALGRGKVVRVFSTGSHDMPTILLSGLPMAGTWDAYYCLGPQGIARKLREAKP